MAFCNECGANIQDEKKFCTECGKPMAGAPPSTQTFPSAQEPAQTQTVHTATTVAAPPAAPVQTAPVAPVQSAPVPTGEQPPPAGSPFAVMNAKGFVGSAILMNIPVIGWLICIIWACGGCKNRNKRNFARANLIFLAVIAVLALVVYLMLDWLIALIVGYIAQFL